MASSVAVRGGPAAGAPRASRLVGVVSDIHFPVPHRKNWQAWLAWVRRNRPWKVIIAGDAMDMLPVSRHDKHRDDPVHLLAEIEECVGACNELAGLAEHVVFMPGNHEKRYERYLHGPTPHVLRGLKGLTLEEQMRANGLVDKVAWYTEKVGATGIAVGQFVVRHGDKQTGRFGGGINLATNRLNKSLGQSELFGHHHVAQMAARSAHGRTAVVIANPCIADYQDYAGSDVTWQSGFTILELDARDYATPYIVLMQDGRFSWGGVTYDGALADAAPEAAARARRARGRRPGR